MTARICAGCGEQVADVQRPRLDSDTVFGGNDRFAYDGTGKMVLCDECKATIKRELKFARGVVQGDGQ